MEDGDSDPVLTIIKWEDFLQDFNRDGDYIHGFVTNESSVDSAVELYRRATKTTFCTRRSSSFQSDPLKCKSKKLCTRSFVFCRTTSPRISDDGVPFTYGGMKILECQYGPKREHRKKSDIDAAGAALSEAKMSCDHDHTSSPGQRKNTSKCRLSTGDSRKRGCHAKISVWHICRLPEYVVTAKKCVTIWQTKAKERLLRDLEAGRDVTTESRFYISFPLQRAHSKHTPWSQAGEAHCVHPQLIQWIDQLVSKGVTTARDVQAILRHNVQSTMSDFVAPDERDRAYYPTLKDVANHIYKSKVKRRSAACDFGSLGTEPQLQLVGEHETTGSCDERLSAAAPAHLQLEELHGITEDTVHTQEVCRQSLDEDARRERTELRKQLNAIRRSSNRCSDAGRLAELKVAIKALHDQFRTDAKEQLSLAEPDRRRRRRGESTELLPAKTPRVDDHTYLTP